MISKISKRTFDFTVALTGLIALSPFLLITAFLVLAIDGRPIIFTQNRVGRGGRLFPLYKFRTMRNDNRELLITSEGDSRVTAIGHWLRRYKMDELPQLLNVLKGEMSLVGPRPEVPRFVDLFKEEYDQILTIRPGVTDPASIKFRNESAIMAIHGNNTEDVYLEKIMPVKLKYNLDYVRDHNFVGDILLIANTVAIMFRPSGKEPDQEML